MSGHGHEHGADIVSPGLTPGDFEKEGLTAPQVAMQCSTVRTDSHESDEESGESSPPEPRGSFPGSSSKRKAPVLHHNHAREPRYAIQTRTDLQNIDDGYKWRKYGQKGVINGLHPRIYYKCNTHKCPVRKRVERSTEDPSLLITTYEGTHAHAHPSFHLKSPKHSPRPGGPGSTPRDRDKEGLTAPQLHMAHESGEKATTSGDDNDVDVAMTLHRMERSTEDPGLLLSESVKVSSLADPAPSFYQHLQAGDTGWTPSDLDTIRLIHDPLESCYVDSKFQAWNVVDQMEPVVQHDFNLDYRRRHRGDGGGKLKSLLFHGGSVWDAWFSAASNQVAQVLLTLPYSFAQLGFASGIVFQIFYGVIGCWSCYMITCLYCEYRTRKEREGVIFKNHVIQWFEVLDGLLGRQWKVLGLVFNCTFLLFGAVIQLIACASNIFLINDNIDKREWTYIFGACCMLTVLVPSFRNYRLWSFFGLIMISYTAWYMTVAALAHGQVLNVVHSAPTTKVLYFTGATNILYTFGGHAVTVEIMHAMDKPVKFKYVYVFATLYLFTLTIPSAVAVYWAFGDSLLKHSNALSLLPRTHARDVAVVLMLIHQFIMVGFAVTPLYFMWEKRIGIHKSKSLLLRAVARMPVILPVWFLAIAFPFFGPINSAVGALLVTFTVYIIPCVAHMVVYRGATARQNAVEKPPFFLPSWTGVYLVNMFIVIWIAVVGVGWGGWASITNFVRQVDTFGVFAPCYQCPPKSKY